MGACASSSDVRPLAKPVVKPMVKTTQILGEKTKEIEMKISRKFNINLHRAFDLSLIFNMSTNAVTNVSPALVDLIGFVPTTLRKLVPPSLWAAHQGYVAKFMKDTANEDTPEHHHIVHMVSLIQRDGVPVKYTVVLSRKHNLLPFVNLQLRRPVTKEENNGRRNPDDASRRVSKLLRHKQEREQRNQRDHEIRGAMQAIEGGCGILMTSLVNPSVSRQDLMEVVRLVYASSKHVETMMTSMLDYNMINANAYKKRSDTFILRNFLDLHTKTVGLRAQVPVFVSSNLPKDLVIVTDTFLLRSVLSNALSNAAKNTKEGTIEVVAGMVDNVLRLAVTDTGCGIPSNSEIFSTITRVPWCLSPRKLNVVLPKAEETTLPPSTSSGIGHRMMQTMVNVLEGGVTIASQETLGTVVTITVPVELGKSLSEQHKEKTYRTYDEALDPDNDTPRSTDTEKVAHLLIVDDVAINVTIMKRMCAPFAEVISTASTCVEALEIARNNPNINCVLMDYELNEPMTGAELGKELAGCLLSFRMALVSGNLFELTDPRLLGVFDAVLPKPCSATRLHQFLFE